jgi:glucosamine 6-phosphate synthetase-like amidotransferase/phosphosugar isomerase protein
MGFAGTGLWADVQEVPGALTATLEAAAGVAEAAALLRGEGVTRVVAVGNGAAYYVAHALWLASLESSVDGGPTLVAAPCGVAVSERFGWRSGDAVLAISSSGEFRDVVEIAQRGRARWCVAITADAGSSLARAATATVLQHVDSQRAVTHTQALCGAYAIGLALWAAVAGDGSLAAVAGAAPEAAAGAIAMAEEWAPDSLDGRTPPAAAVAAGGGTAWAAALELALMLKEIARVPAEGVETREGATSAMFGLDRGHLMVSLDPAGDPLGDEALRLCAATGADTLQLPSLPGADPRLAPITTLPASAALAAQLALAGGHDVDHPTWTNAYHATARSAT